MDDNLASRLMKVTLGVVSEERIIGRPSPDTFIFGIGGGSEKDKGFYVIHVSFRHKLIKVIEPKQRYFTEAEKLVKAYKSVGEKFKIEEI